MKIPSSTRNCDPRAPKLAHQNHLKLSTQNSALDPHAAAQIFNDKLSFISKQKLTRSMITPEIAAFVVKEYLLPMFESDGKKL